MTSRDVISLHHPTTDIKLNLAQLTNAFGVIDTVDCNTKKKLISFYFLKKIEGFPNFRLFWIKKKSKIKAKFRDDDVLDRGFNKVLISIISTLPKNCETY